MNQEKTFSKKEAIKFGWEHTKDNLGFFIGVVAIAWLVSFVPERISQSLGEQYPVTVFLITLLGVIFSILVDMGLINISLAFLDDSTPKIRDLFTQHPLFFAYLGASIIYSLIVLVGLLLLIVPGIIWGIKFQLFGFLIIDQKIGGLEGIKRSAAVTDGAKKELFVFNLLLMIINIAGALLFGIGLILSIPTTLLAIAFVYRKLLSQTDFETEE